MRPLPWLGLLVLVACVPLRGFDCHCVPEAVQQQIDEDHARAPALLEPFVAAQGEFLRVPDEALGTDWIAVDPGMNAWRPMGVSMRWRIDRARSSLASR